MKYSVKYSGATMKYRVFCSRHNYDTFFTLDNVNIAKTAARMHSLLPCDSVTVTDAHNKEYDWKEAAAEEAKLDVTFTTGTGFPILPPEFQQYNLAVAAALARVQSAAGEIADKLQVIADDLDRAIDQKNSPVMVRRLVGDAIDAIRKVI